MSLFDVLHGSMGISLNWASRYSIAVGVAQGLSFLHGIASASMLLLDLSRSFSAVAGSVGYIPPAQKL
ncbi:hypothetical protein RIF29_39847 [Crotalaria pallida]|uniref:Uncharacterized protein n=1 Tax=Crotalaria pallida TaxID=3830 RepID=A0AAN9E8B4_CROPI